MNNIVAKRYAKALMEKFSKEELEGLLFNLKILSDAFSYDKFSSIINSPIVNKEVKDEFVFSMFEEDLDPKFKNFIKLLSEKKRLDLVPEILSNIQTKVSSLNNEYNGIIYSNKALAKTDIKKIEQIFSKKFDAVVKLEHQKVNYSGIKVDIEELGVEISFSMDRLKHDINEYILRAI